MKLAHVLGATSVRSCTVIRPAAVPPMLTSRNALGSGIFAARVSQRVSYEERTRAAQAGGAGVERRAEDAVLSDTAGTGRHAGWRDCKLDTSSQRVTAARVEQRVGEARSCEHVIGTGRPRPRRVHSVCLGCPRANCKGSVRGEGGEEVGERSLVAERASPDGDGCEHQTWSPMRTGVSATAAPRRGKGDAPSSSTHSRPAATAAAALGSVGSHMQADRPCRGAPSMRASSSHW